MNGNFQWKSPPHLTHRTSRENLISPACSVDGIFWKFLLEIILLPHSDRGSRQLLLSRTDTFEHVVPALVHLTWESPAQVTSTCSKTCCHPLILVITSHVSDVMGVIVLTLFVCLCVCVSVCYLSHGRTYRHIDLNFGMKVKWKDIQVKFIGQGHKSNVKVTTSKNVHLGRSIDIWEPFLDLPKKKLVGTRPGMFSKRTHFFLLNTTLCSNLRHGRLIPWMAVLSWGNFVQLVGR